MGAKAAGEETVTISIVHYFTAVHAAAGQRPGHVLGPGLVEVVRLGHVELRGVVGHVVDHRDALAIGGEGHLEAAVSRGQVLPVSVQVHEGDVLVEGRALVGGQ